jgi:hypothetical protein
MKVQNLKQRELDALFVGLEFGYKCCEKGMNLLAANMEAKQLIDACEVVLAGVNVRNEKCTS